MMAKFKTTRGYVGYAKFYLTREATKDRDFRRRFQTEKFTGIVLGHPNRGGSFNGYDKLERPIVLIVDWVGEVAERIGYVIFKTVMVWNNEGRYERDLHK